MQMEMFIKDYGKMIKQMVKADILIWMVQNIKEIG